MVLVIDFHKPVQRTATLEAICGELGFQVRVVAHVWGDSRVQDPWEAFANLVEDAESVLMHVGPRQIDAAEALRRMHEKRCLAYFGGQGGEQDEVAEYFADDPSVYHGLIKEERVELSLQLNSAAGDKLKHCLRLILKDGRRPPEAIEEVYGDPKLEGVLNDVYRKLLPWKDLEEIKKDRDEQLGKYYETKRGWALTAGEAEGSRGRSEAIAAHLESGTFPDEGDAARLLYAAEIKIMRDLVARRPALVERMLQFAEAETGARAAFALALIRHACAQPETAVRLRRLFDERAATDSGLACHLVWRVLDDPDLPEDWHKRLINYLMSNWDAWKRHLAEFKEPGPDGMLAVIRGRLDDPTYPSSKKWIYLLCLPDGLASNGQEAERIIREAGTSGEGNIHLVAEALLRRFYN